MSLKRLRDDDEVPALEPIEPTKRLRDDDEVPASELIEPTATTPPASEPIEPTATTLINLINLGLLTLTVASLPSRKHVMIGETGERDALLDAWRTLLDAWQPPSSITPQVTTL